MSIISIKNHIVFIRNNWIWYIRNITNISSCSKITASMINTTSRSTCFSNKWSSISNITIRYIRFSIIIIKSVNSTKISNAISIPIYKISNIFISIRIIKTKSCKEICIETWGWICYSRS